MSMTFILQLLTLSLTALMTLWALARWKLYGFLFGGLAFYSFVLLIGIPSLETEFGHGLVARAVAIGLIGTTCFGLCVLLAEFATGPRRNAVRRNPVAEVAQIWLPYLVCVCLFILVAIAIASRRGSDILTGNWEDVRSTTDILDSLASLLQFFVFPSAWIAFRCGYRRLSVVLLLLSLMLFPVIGSRAGLLTLPAVIALDLFRSSMSRQRILALVVIVIVAGLTMHVTGRVVRGLGMGGLVDLARGRIDVAELAQEISSQVEWTGGESEIARYFVYSVSTAEFEGASSLASVVRWLLIYIPRRAATDVKPEDVTYVMWRHAANDGVFESYPSLNRLLELLRGGDSGSIHPLLWGELWANGGGTALVVACAVLAILVVLIERALANAPGLVAALVAPATIVGYFMVARGNSAVGLGYFFYLFPVALGAYAACMIAWATIFGQTLRVPKGRDNSHEAPQTI